MLIHANENSVFLSSHTHALTRLQAALSVLDVRRVHSFPLFLSLCPSPPGCFQSSRPRTSRCPPAVRPTSCNLHVWLLVWAWSTCRFVGEPLSFWVAHCVWTGLPPGRHTQSGSLKVLWHRWHPFFPDTRIGPPRCFSWTEQRWEMIRKTA